MAELALAFRRAITRLEGVGLRETRTQEVLELPGVQGIAWRSYSNPKVLQFYPRTPLWTARRENGALLLSLEQKRCVYPDPHAHLRTDVWFYVGCRDCSILPDHAIDEWLDAAYRHLVSHRRWKGQGR